jgi:NitT/TauT family transport system substrate-binding protein
MRVRASAIARRLLVTLATGALLLGIAACGDDSDSGSAATSTGTATQGAAQKTDTLKVALYPSTDYAALYAGIKAGVFEKHGLKLDIKQVLTGSGLTAAITSGKADVGTNSPTSMSTGISNGLPVKMISVADTIPTEGYVEVLVKKDSDIQDYGDLAGKQVATINLQGLFHLGVLNAVKKAGGDPASVKALAMAPTDEPQALSAGRVDAIVLQDPFVATAKKNPKFRSLGNPFAQLDYKIPAGGFFSSNKIAAEKGPALQRFKEALAEASKMTQDDPSLARAAIPTYTELKADAVEKIGLPVYGTDFPDAALTQMLDQMKTFGWLKKVPATSDIVWSGA